MPACALACGELKNIRRIKSLGVPPSQVALHAPFTRIRTRTHADIRTVQPRVWHCTAPFTHPGDSKRKRQPTSATRLVTRLSSSRHSTATTPTAAHYLFHSFIPAGIPEANRSPPPTYRPTVYPIIERWSVPLTGLAHRQCRHLHPFAPKAVRC